MKKTKAMSSMFHKILITIFALTVIANFANAQWFRRVWLVTRPSSIQRTYNNPWNANLDKFGYRRGFQQPIKHDFGMWAEIKALRR